MMFIGQADNDFSPGIESLETQLFTEDDIPWDQLAFPVVGKTLKSFFSDRANLVDKSEVKALSAVQVSNLPVHNFVHKIEK